MNFDWSTITGAKSFFMLNITYYRQKCSIAMRTRAAPIIANLVMGYLKLKINHSSLLKFVISCHSSLKYNWKAYLDDCFILWNDSVDNLIDFKKHFL